MLHFIRKNKYSMKTVLYIRNMKTKSHLNNTALIITPRRSLANNIIIALTEITILMLIYWSSINIIYKYDKTGNYDPLYNERSYGSSSN